MIEYVRPLHPALHLRELVALYRLTQPAVNLQPRYNIPPTTTIDVVITRGGDRLELVPMRWGLIPSWSVASQMAQVSSSTAGGAGARPALSHQMWS
jgi:putative SOS response-associated peptidase YedK